MSVIVARIERSENAGASHATNVLPDVAALHPNCRPIVISIACSVKLCREGQTTNCAATGADSSRFVLVVWPRPPRIFARAALACIPIPQQHRAPRVAGAPALC